MRLVIDTNVLIAAFISPRGKSSEVLERCIALHEVVCSEFILTELHAKLIQKFRRDPADVVDAISLLRTRFEIVTPEKLKAPASRDANDEPILGTALAGQAEKIVTGDKDLLSLNSYMGIQIVSPTVFMEQEQTE